jgi:hypothetical protein
MAVAQDYRRYAAQCIQLAEKSPTPDDKAKWLKMAELWEHLAHANTKNEPPKSVQAGPHDED